MKSPFAPLLASLTLLGACLLWLSISHSLQLQQLQRESDHQREVNEQQEELLGIIARRELNAMFEDMQNRSRLEGQRRALLELRDELEELPAPVLEGEPTPAPPLPESEVVS